MSKKTKIILLVLECVLLVTVAALCGLLFYREHLDALQATTQPTTAEPTTTAAPTTQATTAPEPTEPETTAPEVTEPPTEPEPEPVSYWLSFAGDCTLGSQKGDTRATSFLNSVGDNYTWPFAGVLPIFESDEFTMVNLEGPLTSSTDAADKEFVFKGPEAYAICLSAGSINCVSLANNHTYDYGSQGYQDTQAALDGEGIAYAGRNETLVVTTPGGLVIGILANAYGLDNSTLRTKIGSLKKAGAEVIIFSMHWGDEGSYTPNASQKKLARAAIDAGADIVFGHHPHVLQPMEEYNGGIICYSLGNFSFGGNQNPPDKDTAIVQQEVIREVDGTVHLGETRVIPCSVSSVANRNDFQPTPLEEGTAAYDRVMSKLDGSFSG